MFCIRVVESESDGAESEYCLYYFYCPLRALAMKQKESMQFDQLQLRIYKETDLMLLTKFVVIN